MKIHVTSNDASDLDTKNVVKKFMSKNDNLFYHENQRNVGIDANHDLMYKYCDTDYVLMLADDDCLLPGSLSKIIEFIKGHSFLFAITNQKYLIKDGIEENKFFPDGCCTKMNKKKAFSYFIFDKPVALLPLLPYFGGIVVNKSKIDKLVSEHERNMFSGTYHQYVGSLWYALLKSIDEDVYILNDTFIGQGLDDDKTWFGFQNEVFKNVSKFYEILPVEQKIKKVILYVYNNYNSCKLRLMRPLLKAYSRKWRI